MHEMRAACCHIQSPPPRTEGGGSSTCRSHTASPALSSCIPLTLSLPLHIRVQDLKRHVSSLIPPPPLSTHPLRHTRIHMDCKRKAGDTRIVHEFVLRVAHVRVGAHRHTSEKAHTRVRTCMQTHPNNESCAKVLH